MITAIFGLPGSGKTTALARFAARAQRGKSLRCGKCWLQSVDSYDYVYSNTPIAGAYKLDVGLLGKCAFRRSLILVDESVVIADSRDYKSLDKSLMMFFKQHRKLDDDIILASQGYKDNDLRIRDLYEQILYAQRYPFGLTRLSTVDKSIDINKTIDESYVQGGIFHSSFIVRKKWYPLFDTKYMHGYKLADPPPPEKW